MRSREKPVKIFAPTALAAALGILWPVLAAADDILCDGRFGAETLSDNLKVPAGATCLLEGTIVQGNVTVKDNALLVAIAATIEGNVKLDGGFLGALGATIYGNLDAKRAESVLLVQDLPGPDPGAASTIVYGNVHVRKATDSTFVCETEIGGNLKADRNVGDVLMGERSACFFSNIFNGNVQVKRNAGEVVVSDNFIAGNLQAKRNVGGVTISDNEIHGNLECRRNGPVASGVPGSNVVLGNKEGECVGL